MADDYLILVSHSTIIWFVLLPYDGKMRCLVGGGLRRFVAAVQIPGHAVSHITIGYADTRCQP